MNSDAPTRSTSMGFNYSAASTPYITIDRPYGFSIPVDQDGRPMASKRQSFKLCSTTINRLRLVCFLVFRRSGYLYVMKLAQLCSALQFLHNHVPVVIHANLKCVRTQLAFVYLARPYAVLSGKRLSRPRG